jgi:PAS domain S-box-containing protein
MNQEQKDIKIKFTFIGILIGIIFPLISWIVILKKEGLNFSISSISFIHSKEFSLYIVDIAPIVLGLIFYILIDYAIKIRNKLEKSIQKINKTLAKNSEFAKKIGQGDLEAQIEVEPDDLLGQSLMLMRNNLIENQKREAKQTWITKGKEIISDILRFHNKLEDLSYETLVAIVDYINAVQGAFYIYENEDDENEKNDEKENLLKNIATYAYNRRKYLKNTFKIGEGLIGAAAYEKEIIYRKEIPDDYITISSGILGDQKPKTLIIVPLLGDEKLQGVIEIASLQKEIDNSVINLLQEISGIIGQTVFNLKVNAKTQKLLNESREMTEKLKKNEEELKRNTQEIIKTQIELEETNRKLAAQIAEVERARKRLYSLLENASEVISIYNQNGIITYESPSIIHILGYKADELIGKNGFSVFDETTNQKIKTAFFELIENPQQTVSFEYSFKRDDEEIWLETIGRNLLNNPAINGIIFNTRDITVRKIAEKAQRMSGRMQALSENSPDMIVRVNTEGRFYYINPVAEKFIGLGKRQLIGKTFYEIQIPEEIDNIFKNALKQLVEEPIKLEFETSFHLADEQKEIIVQFNAIPEFSELNELETILYVAHDITEQKQIQIEIEKKNKSITESINYARRIQTAILPTETKIKDILPKSFMFYLPRDVVSGDIPWIYKKDKNIFIAAIDCTGHGVPGALLSFIGYFLLNNIVSMQGDSLNSGQILDKLHQDVRKTLKQDSPDAEARDGMDIALCKINYQKNQMDFAGAHRPLYLLKNNGEFVQYKGTLKAIGGIPMKNKKEKSFANHIINFHNNDKFFIFSDGLADQVGGEKNRKFKNSKIKEIIEKNKEASIFDFYSIIENEYFTWKGSNKQIDDILLIGVEL